MCLDEPRSDLDSALHQSRANRAAGKLHNHPKTGKKHHVRTNFTMKTIDSRPAVDANRSAVADLVIYNFFRSEKHC